MADLKPLGSEKLQGMEKIQRILEIARFNESTPSRINETSKNEYSLQLADGNEYQIVREKTGYIIKQTISESEVDYIAPMRERKYYDSYSQALKRLNLMAKEMNELYGNDEGTSLFSEQKRFTLKTPKSEKKNSNPTDEVENVPPPPPPPAAPSGDVPPPPPAPTDDMGDVPPPPPAPDDMSTDDMGSDDMGTDDMEMGDMEGNEENDEIVTFKTIQKLTGKLGQKLRTLNSSEDDEESMSSKDIKYVINSILSALDLEKLDEDDMEDILNKLEGAEEEFNPEEKFGNDDEDENEEDNFDEELPIPGDEEPIGFGEMSEENAWAELGNDIAQTTALKATGARFGSNGTEMSEDSQHLESIASSMFESKIEDTLMKYFNITESEKKFNKTINEERKVKTKITLSELNGEIKRLSESVQQEVSAKKFLKENVNAKLVGKTNKKNLVFELGYKQYKISPKGSLI